MYLSKALENELASQFLGTNITMIEVSYQNETKNLLPQAKPGKGPPLFKKM